MAGYTREFLISVYLSRFYSLPPEDFEFMEAAANKCYDEYGKDGFRYWCAIDAEKIRKFKLEYGS